jgi:hypothetical protein
MTDSHFTCLYGAAIITSPDNENSKGNIWGKTEKLRSDADKIDGTVECVAEIYQKAV